MSTARDHVPEPRIDLHELRPAGASPGNGLRPVVVYHAVFEDDCADMAAAFEALFARHGWGGAWRNGVFPYRHFHPVAHEVLGVYAGRAEVELGADGGARFVVARGDAVVIPAGVAHRRLDRAGGFAVVGAYPAGQSSRVLTEDGPEAAAEAAAVPAPAADPIRGKPGMPGAGWG